MKRLSIFIFIILTLPLYLGAQQISVNLNVDSNPNPRISDWINRAELAMFTVTNTDPRQEGLPYRIGIRMEQNGNTVVSTRLQDMPILELEIGSQVYLADELIQYSALQFTGNFEQKLIQTGLLPAGIYSFCASDYDLSGRAISMPEEGCRPMRITSYQAPEVMYPTGDVPIMAQALPGLQLSWSPMSPTPPPGDGVKYIVVVSEIEIPQSASQAFFVNYPIIEEEVIGSTQLLWPVDIDPPTQTTHYVWGVKAVSMDDDPWIADNNGFSNLGTFSINVPQDPIAEEEEEEPEVTPGDIAVDDIIFAGENGEFEVLVTSATANGPTAWDGEGTVFVNWLMARVDVAFDSITVDENQNLVNGDIIAKIHDTAPVYPVDWALEAAANLPFTNNVANNIVDWVENTSGQTIPYENLNEFTQPVKMPLGVLFPDGNELAMTEMVFRPDKSEFNMIAAKTVPPSFGTTRLGFRAKEIRFHPNTIEMPPGRIELVEDITMGNVNNQIQFVFKAPEGNNLGTFIEWDEDGFSEFGLQLDALFTRDWMIPSPDNDPNKKVTASLTANASAWDDIIFGGTLERAEIVNSAGMTILADSIYYDFSDTKNPPAITFPENYEGETSDLFRGFYMKAFEIELPDTWETHSGGQIKIGIHDMIIDDMGITMKARAENILEFPNANVADLVASIDTVHVELIANSLVEAGINGRIGLPFSKKDSIQHPLQYVALLSLPNTPGEPDNFQLTITPTGPVEAHLLKGEFDLAETSNIVAYVSEHQRTFDLNLDGTFRWTNVTLGPVNNVNLGLDFEGLGLSYDSADQNGLGFNIGSWAFASEQKFLANFPVTIDNIGYTMLAPQQSQLLRGRINFDVIFNLSEDIGGMSGLGVEMAIEDGTAGQKFFPKYLSTTIDSINVHANLAAVEIQGGIGFRNDHPVFGNGFIGTLSANFKPVGVQVSALAEFGNTNYQNGNSLYRYWRVEADAILPPPGVPFLPGVAFRGFGGGAFYNMNPIVDGNAFTFEPQKSSLGFRASAVIATTPKEDSFNGDVGLLGQFSTSGGLTYLAFTGDFWIGAEMTASARADAIASGDLIAQYNFPDRHFNFATNININAPPVTTPSPINMVLDINGKTNKWYFKLGEPQNLNTVRVFGINTYEYLMFGNDIPFPSGFTSGFANAYQAAVGHAPGNVGNGGVGSETNTGSGFALGIGFRFEHDDLKNLTGNYYLAYQLGAGAELHLAFLDYAGGCASYNPVGINGWRANGGLGFYGHAGAQVRRIGGVLADKTWNIASLAAGAWVYGEFPNPYYASGAVSGRATVFKVIDVNFHKSFQVGSQCSNVPTGGGAPVVQGDVAADQMDKLIQYVNPTASFNFPEDEPLAVKFGLTPDEVFDVSEQQGDGTIQNRTFKMEYTRSLQIQAEGGGNNWSNVMTNTNQNALGEYLFTTISSSISIDPGLTMAGGPPVTGGSTGGTGTSGTTGGAATGPASLANGGGINTVGQTVYGANSLVFMQMSGLEPPATTNNTSGGSGPMGQDVVGSPAGFGFQVPYPVDPPEPSYGDLPPQPTPPTNNLESDRNYRFTVTATLKEYVNGNWVTAQTNAGNPVTETVTKNFRTGPMQLVQSNQNILRN
ncbi:MAG: hypothetical protein LAT57_03290 [Balneolales bacterium]|nr:hypothetical protein [Balneolales bacterium]